MSGSYRGVDACGLKSGDGLFPGSPGPFTGESQWWGRVSVALIVPGEQLCGPGSSRGTQALEVRWRGSDANTFHQVTTKSGFCLVFGKGLFPVACVSIVWEVTSKCHRLSGIQSSFLSSPLPPWSPKCPPGPCSRLSSSV